MTFENGQQRLAAGVEYDGTPFLGWQRQKQGPTVQAVLADAISKVADHPVEVHAAGRTDTGVHAWCQVIHFDVTAKRDMRSWQLGAQSHLAEGVAIRWVQPVPDDFHARYAAVSRHYRYRIINRVNRPALDRHRVAWVYQSLDAGLMHEAAQSLIGEHDFTSFRAAGCQSQHARRCIHTISVTRQGDEVVMDVVANAFLYHMVRNIVGSLILVGRGERAKEWVGEVLELKDRRVAGMTAPSQGLYFMTAHYKPEWNLPKEVTVI